MLELFTQLNDTVAGVGILMRLDELFNYSTVTTFLFIGTIVLFYQELFVFKTWKHEPLNLVRSALMVFTATCFMGSYYNIGIFSLILSGILCRLVTLQLLGKILKNKKDK